MNHRRHITRRAFLEKTVGIAGAVVAFPYFVQPSALGKAGTVAACDRITVGFIGTGGHGRAVNLTNFLGNADAQAVAVCDVDPNQRDMARDMVNKKYGNADCATYSDFREVIARKDIDAVMISTPDHWHVPISIAAAKAGKDVECEKPTLTVEEGRVLCETMKRYGRVFQWSTEDRSVDVYHRMCEFHLRPVILSLCLYRKVLIMICGWARRPGHHIPRTAYIGTSGGFLTIPADN